MHITTISCLCSVVSSFAICYRNKLWRNEIAVRKRLEQAKMLRRNTKEDIIFNLATSSGMSGGLVWVKFGTYQ